ncbi:MAG: FAD-dependent oxidoreductase [Chloroflexi bacterium]|nr:FAD-dependent oxidoreductase [Chloroflexota bacterium]
MRKANPLRIGILGAGVAGLAAAWELTRAGHQVECYEAAPQVGGLAAGFREPEWEWSLEKFYHHWFTNDRDALRLIDEIGARDQLRILRPKTSIWIEGRSYRTELSPASLSLPLSPLALARMAFTILYLKFTRNWAALEGVTADRWLRRWLGDEGYEGLFRPLLIGKFADAFDQVNMAWFWARAVKRTTKLATFAGGFQAFNEALAAAVRAQGAQIHLNAPVRALQFPQGQPTLETPQGSQRFDRVLITGSPRLLLRLAPQLAETDYGAQLRSLRSIGAICAIFSLREPLLTDGTYWLSLPAQSADRSRNEFPFLVLVEHTNFIDRRHFNGEHLIYCGDYVPSDHEYFQLDEASLLARFRAALPKVNANFRDDWLRRSWLFRAPYAQPVPTLNHSAHIPPSQTPLPGLFWVSMSQVYPWDRGTNYAIELARRAAALMMGETLPIMARS